MSTFQPMTGGCLCGRIRYLIAAPPLAAGYCHCRMCQRASGAPAQVWAQIPVESFRYTSEEPAVFHSSAWGERRFCPSCGSQLEFRLREAPECVDLNVPTLDDASEVRPGVHIWTKDRLAWFDTRDECPRFPEGEADP